MVDHSQMRDSFLAYPPSKVPKTKLPQHGQNSQYKNVKYLHFPFSDFTCPTFMVGGSKAGSSKKASDQPDGPSCIAECRRRKKSNPSINGVVMYANNVNNKGCFCMEQMHGVNAGATHLKTCKF